MLFAGLRCDGCGLVLTKTEDIPKGIWQGQLASLVAAAGESQWRCMGHARDYCPTCKPKTAEDRRAMLDALKQQEAACSTSV